MSLYESTLGKSQFLGFSGKATDEPAAKPNPFQDLPRQINPQGVDDTERICSRVIYAYPETFSCRDQTYNRRALYMAILSVRATRKGWCGDAEVNPLTAERPRS